MNLQRASLHGVTLMISLAVAACVTPPTAGTGPEFILQSPEAGAAVIYHYRQEASFGRGNTYELYYMNQVVTRIGNGGYFMHKVLPGNIEYLSSVYHEFTGLGIVGGAIANAVRDATPVLNVDAANATAHFYRWTVASSGYARVEQVDRETAASEIKGLKAWTLSAGKP